jgi:hypothetical protein
MARARNIKPSFFSNEQLAEQSFEARILFIGLWTLADREGRLEDRHKKIKMALFPADNVDVDQLLGSLHDCGLIERYESDGIKCIEIPKFAIHQSPHGTEKDSLLPCKNGFYYAHERNSKGFVTRKLQPTNKLKTGFEQLDNSSLTVNAPLINQTITVKASEHNALNPESLILNPDEGKLASSDDECQPSKPPLTAKPSTKGRRLPTDWTLPDDWRTWCKTKRPDLDPEEVAFAFRNYWVALPGAKACKLDWYATWQNWVDRQSAPPAVRLVSNGAHDPFEGAR